MPTKAMIRSAEVMHLVARRASEFGVEVEGAVRFDLTTAVARKKRIVDGIIRGIHADLDRRRREIDFVRGEAQFLSKHEIHVDGRRISFEKAIIATGARNVVPPIEGIGDVPFLTNRSALELDTLPSSLIIVGAGYVGLEFAQMYARFGTSVTLLGRNAHVAPGEDPELSDLLESYLCGEGIDVRTGAEVLALRAGDGEVVTTARNKGEEVELRASHLLVATGRVGHTDCLDLPAAGVATSDAGFVDVDGQLCTSQSNIWAIGDVTGGAMYTHVATHEGPIAALNAVRDLGGTVDYRVVPRAVFTDPTLAAVGLTEHEARDQGHDVLVGEVPVGGARASAIGDRRGRLKAVVDADSKEILGFHLLAPHGDDLLHEAVVAMHDAGRIDRISKSIHVHPTLSEMVKAAAKAAR